MAGHFHGRAGWRNGPPVGQDAAAFPDAPEYLALPLLPKGLTAEDLATLAVTYLIQIGAKTAESYVSGLGGREKRQPRIGMTIGVPMGLGQHEHLRDRFVGIARTALDLHHNAAPSLEAGLSVATAKKLLDASRKRLKAKGPVHDPREWVRSEAEAGLLWIFQSPNVPPGLYICVDVGAGTTDVSVFRIAQTFEDDVWIKGKLAFYSAVSSMPGVDALDQAITKALDGACGDVRGLEGELIVKHGLTGHPELQHVLRKMFAVYQNAWREGYRKLVELRHWEDFGLFVLGGGSKIAEVTRTLGDDLWKGQLAGRNPCPHDVPSDIYELPEGRQGSLVSFKGDGTFLLVAYGLSFMGGDVPPCEAPDQMPNYAPPRNPTRSIDQDEYYPK